MSAKPKVPLIETDPEKYRSATAREMARQGLPFWEAYLADRSDQEALELARFFYSRAMADERTVQS